MSQVLPQLVDVQGLSDDKPASSIFAVARDRSIDVLRGIAIMLMTVSHVGAKSHLSAVLHLPLWFSAASPFILLSGTVIGMRAARRPPEKRFSDYRRLADRALMLWVIHCVLLVAVLLIHEATGRLKAPSIAAVGGWTTAAWMIPILRLQARDYMNILPMFIVFLLAAPLLLEAMRRSATLPCLFVSFSLWVVTQRYPGWMHFTASSVGPDWFQLPAWQFPFVLGLAIGFHRERLRASGPSPWKTWATRLACAGVFVLFVIAQLQRNILKPLGGHLPDRWGWLLAHDRWAPLEAIYAVGLLFVGHLALQRLFQGNIPIFVKGAAMLETLGKRSLYSFLVHLPLALLASGIVIESQPRWLQEGAVVAALVIVYQMAKHDVLKRYIPN